MAIHGPVHSNVGLDTHGLKNLGGEHWNLGVPALYEQALSRGEGSVADGGPLVVLTGQHTGRSAGDKFIVRDAATESDVDWGKITSPWIPAHFDGLKQRFLAYYQGARRLRAGPLRRRRSGFPGQGPGRHGAGLAQPVCTPAADPCRSTTVRRDFEPDFTIIHAPGFLADPALDGSRFADRDRASNFEQRLVLIGGTSYAGEIKKSVFSILNFLLPPRDVLPMHCSVNVGDERRIRRSSSACRAPARRRCRPIPGAPWWATTSTAGATTACSISRAAATPR